MKPFVQGIDFNGNLDETIQFSESGQAAKLLIRTSSSIIVPGGAKKARIKVGDGQIALVGKTAISADPGSSFEPVDYDVISGESEMRFVKSGETLYVYALTACTVKVSFYS